MLFLSFTTLFYLLKTGGWQNYSLWIKSVPLPVFVRLGATNGFILLNNYFWKKTKTTMWQRPCDLQSLKYLTTWPFEHLSTPGLNYIITRKMVTITTSREATESRKNGFVFFHYFPEFYIFCIICFYIIFVSLN